MASPIASPVPLHFSHSGQGRLDLQVGDAGRNTPLLQYEKTQSQSLPFTLNLQEDARNPGQFQLVVNVGAKNGLPLNPGTAGDISHKAREDLSTNLGVSSLYQTQKSSPPTSPLQDKQGWADLDAVPPQFLQKIVPDWNVTFSRSDSTASTQSKRLADIKARIKKKGKGYVVRLMKGSTADPSDVAEVELGQQSLPAGGTDAHELDSASFPAELDCAEVSVAPTCESIIGRKDVYEIGTSNEAGITRQQGNLTNELLPYALSVRRLVQDNLAHSSIIEEGLSDAETLIPDVRSIDDRIDEDQTDLEPLSRSSSIYLTRSASVSSIIKTPTRGLSVVGPVRRVEKVSRTRGKSKASSPDLKRSDARKSVKMAPSHVVIQSMLASISSEQDHRETPELRAKTRRTSRNSNEPLSISYQHDGQQDSLSPVKTRRSRRSATIDAHTSTRSETRLRLQTSIPQVKSPKMSPAARRLKSTNARYPVGVSASSRNLLDDLDGNTSSPDWSEAGSDEELRKAVGIALSSTTSGVMSSEGTHDERIIPEIVEPVDHDHVGEIPLPSELEIRSIPRGGRSTTLRLWGLALSALADKAHEGFSMLRDRYGAEPPVPHGHVRVRWTCSCGEALYDDYIEQHPNAARLLEAYLNRPRAHTPRSPTSQSSTSSSMTSIFDTSSRASTLATPSSTYGGARSWGKSSDASKYSPTRVKSNNPFSVRMPTNIEDSWLLTCANEGRLTPKIVHIDVNEGRIRSDKDLALALREHYDQLNRRWYNWARLRGLTTIEFVQFEVHRNRFADIRATPSMPPKSTASSTTGDPEKSQSPSQHPYTFEPNDLLPPVGSSYLLHLFKHPTDYDGEMITYLRCPKRRSRLEFGMGWGIHLVEEFLAQRVWAVVMGVCGLSSAVFAIIWTVKKDDMQSAFGVAQWVLGIAVLLVGGLQEWLE